MVFGAEAEAKHSVLPCLMLEAVQYDIAVFGVEAGQYCIVVFEAGGCAVQ